MLILDNGLQFDSKTFRKYCSDLSIKNRYSTPAYPQGNGQAEAVNKVILNGLKKRLDGAKGKWVGNKKYLLVCIDYFTKWVEIEPLANIKDVDVKRFI